MSDRALTNSWKVTAVAVLLWLAAMVMTSVIVVRNGLALGGWDGYTLIGSAMVAALVGSIGSWLVFSSWSGKGVFSASVGCALGLIAWGAGEVTLINLELNWRAAAIEAKVEAKERERLIGDGIGKRLKKAQDELEQLQHVRAASAIDAQEQASLAETVRYAKDKTTLGAITKNCTDVAHELYRKCADVLKLRAEREASSTTATERVKLETVIATLQASFQATSQEGDVGASSRWLAKRSGHAPEFWETMSSLAFLLTFAFGRDLPGYLIGTQGGQTSRKKTARMAENDVVAHDTLVDQGKGIEINREIVDTPAVIACSPALASLPQETPASEQWEHAAENVSAPLLSLPAPSSSSEPEVASAPQKAPKKRAATSSLSWPPNVTPLHQVDRKPGWETRGWLRETLASGPKTRAEVIKLGAEKRLSEGALDGAMRSLQKSEEGAIEAGRGRRPAIWSLAVQAKRKGSKTIGRAQGK